MITKSRKGLEMLEWIALGAAVAAVAIVAYKFGGQTIASNVVSIISQIFG